MKIKRIEFLDKVFNQNNSEKLYDFFFKDLFKIKPNIFVFIIFLSLCIFINILFFYFFDKIKFNFVINFINQHNINGNINLYVLIDSILSTFNYYNSNIKILSEEGVLPLLKNPFIYIVVFILMFRIHEYFFKFSCFITIILSFMCYLDFLSILTLINLIFYLLCLSICFAYFFNLLFILYFFSLFLDIYHMMMSGEKINFLYFFYPVVIIIIIAKIYETPKINFENEKIDPKIFSEKINYIYMIYSFSFIFFGILLGVMSEYLISYKIIISISIFLFSILIALSIMIIIIFEKPKIFFMDIEKLNKKETFFYCLKKICLILTLSGVLISTSNGIYSLLFGFYKFIIEK